jgi:hypothetical protein
MIDVICAKNCRAKLRKDFQQKKTGYEGMWQQQQQQQRVGRRGMTKEQEKEEKE